MLYKLFKTNNKELIVLKAFFYKIREDSGYFSIDVTLAHFIQHPLLDCGKE